MKNKSGGDATGWKRGEKGYAKGGQWDSSEKEFLTPDFDAVKLYGSERPVGQRASVGEGAKLKQEK